MAGLQGMVFCLVGAEEVSLEGGFFVRGRWWDVKTWYVYLCVCVQVCLISIVGLFSLPPSGSIDE